MQRVIAVSVKPASKAALNRKAISFHSLKRCFSVRPESIGKVNAVLIHRVFFITNTDINKKVKVNCFENQVYFAFVSLFSFNKRFAL